MKVVVIGSGSWGTALAQVLADNHHDVIIYGNNPEEINDIQVFHQNAKFFPHVNLHPDLKATCDIHVVKEAQMVVISVPTHAMEAVCTQIAPLLQPNTIVVNTAKGFHPVTHERMSQIIKRCIPKDKLADVVCLLGPSHAEEVVLRMLTTVNSVCEHEESSCLVQQAFANAYFRVYTNTDVVGCEIAVAIKNIIAICSGIANGLGLGDNAKAALMTRGLAEMTRYGLAMGGNQRTFLGLCGVGDLIVTCTSIHSRNYQAGLIIGQANNAKDFWDNNTKTVEGVNACKAIYEQAQELGISMPITEQLYHILFEGALPKAATAQLMTRELKKEEA